MTEKKNFHKTPEEPVEYFSDYRGAGYKTLHKIAVRSYKQPFGGKNLKKRGLITDHFWDRN